MLIYGKHISSENPNKCQSKKAYSYKITFCQKFLTDLKSRILTIKFEAIFFLRIRTYFSPSGWTGSYIFGYLNAKFQPLGSYMRVFTVFYPSTWVVTSYCNLSFNAFKLISAACSRSIHEIIRCPWAYCFYFLPFSLPSQSSLLTSLMSENTRERNTKYPFYRRVH